MSSHKKTRHKMTRFYFSIKRKAISLKAKLKRPNYIEYQQGNITSELKDFSFS